jgi:hypothetical protein
MTLTVFIARFFSVSLLLVSISHLVQPTVWRDYFIRLKQTGVPGIIIGMYTLPLGLLIVIGHNVWVYDVPVIITICGWGMTIKSLTYFLIRGRAEKMIPDGENAHRMYTWGGLVGIPISILLVYSSFFRVA